MRNLTFAILAAVAVSAALGGCKKTPEGPQTTSIQEPTRPMDEMEPVTPPGETESTPTGGDDYVEPIETTEPDTVRDGEPGISTRPPLSSPPAKPAPGVRGESTHTIAKGDTLWSLAERYLGSGKRWKEIVAANPGLDPQKLHVGQTIVIPPR